MLAGALAAPACSGKVTPTGGLMLVLRSDGTLSQANYLELEVTPTGGGTAYKSQGYRIPDEVTLPTTLAIASNGSPTASVVINASLWAGGTLLDDRVNEVIEIPTERVAEVDIVFSASCTAYAQEEGDGGAGSKCPTGQTCEPGQNCVSNVVNGGQLPTFSGDAGSGAGLGASDGGRDATVNASDAGGGSSSGVLVVSPTTAALSVVTGATVPTLQFEATGATAGASVTWSIDSIKLGSVSAGGLFAPSGSLGGVCHITASTGTGGQTATATVTVNLETVNEGDPAYRGSPGDAGASGYGGVGGNGPGGPAGASQTSTLNGTPAVDATVSLLYPYDGTVWPQGILAPLLQWNPGAHSFDSVYVHISESYFDYKGYFASNTTGSFLDLPIPQQAWSALEASNAGEPVKVSLVFAQDGTAYGRAWSPRARSSPRRRWSSDTDAASPSRRPFATPRICTSAWG